MNKFLIVFEDGRAPVGLNTVHQVNTYLKNSVPDVSKVSIYQHALNAVRNRWNFESSGDNSFFVPENGKPVKHNSRWTEKETLRALALRKKGITAKEIGESLGRTAAAVTARINNYAP